VFSFELGHPVSVLHAALAFRENVKPT